MNDHGWSITQNTDCPSYPSATVATLGADGSTSTYTYTRYGVPGPNREIDLTNDAFQAEYPLDYLQATWFPSDTDPCTALEYCAEFALSNTFGAWQLSFRDTTPFIEDGYWICYTFSHPNYLDPNTPCWPGPFDFYGNGRNLTYTVWAYIYELLPPTYPNGNCGDQV